MIINNTSSNSNKVNDVPSNNDVSLTKSRSNESTSNCRLQEARFWTRIMKEHAIFIKLELPCDRTELIGESEKFIEVFQDLQDRSFNETQLTPELLSINSCSRRYNKI